MHSLHSEITVISAVITVLAMEADKITQFTHPSLHFVAIIGAFVLVSSLMVAL